MAWWQYPKSEPVRGQVPARPRFPRKDRSPSTRQTPERRYPAMRSAARLLRISWPALAGLLLTLPPTAARAQDRPVVGLIPKAQRPLKLDGKLDDWDGAFVTPVHVGHPDFANRGAEFLFLWDEHNLYVGLRCLDQKPAHVAPGTQIYNGDAVEFYLDTRRGDQLGAAPFTAGALHMFWTPFTGTEVKPRMQVRDLP